MKQILLIAAILMTFANSAFALSLLPPALAASITETHINHNWLTGANTGSVGINLYNEEITLTLFNYTPCSEGKLCPQGMTVYEVITLPIVDQYVDGCGATVYTADKDMRPVDGLKETISVVDNTTMICDIFIPHATSITYTSVTPGFGGPVVSEMSTFGAEKLVNVHAHSTPTKPVILPN